MPSLSWGRRTAHQLNGLGDQVYAVFLAARPRVVLLAAGQGKRMDPAGAGTPKSLLPIGGEPFAVRLARQAREHGIDDITVVVGYRAEQVRAALATAAGSGARFVMNERFAEDVNVHSLCLALEADASPCFVVEADIWMADSAWDELLAEEDRERSVWYTRGPFGSHQVGGILRAGADRRVEDLRIVPAYEQRYASYDKLVGVTKIGPEESERFSTLLRAARDRNLKQYWLAPWIDNLSELPCYARDVGQERAISVNTPEEYRALQEHVER
jgi:CTP:phosphocholine cytidylyltransferase-like protein